MFGELVPDEVTKKINISTSEKFLALGLPQFLCI